MFLPNSTLRLQRSITSWARSRCLSMSLSLPSTRVDAFNITLANELSRNGRRTGLTFAPEGGSERMRRVINKMVSEDDLIRTVATAYGNGWRQVKLYFMCGLPTETDDDVLQIAQMARRVIQTGREAAGPERRADHVKVLHYAGRPRNVDRVLQAMHPQRSKQCEK